MKKIFFSIACCFFIYSTAFAVRYTDLVITDDISTNSKQISLKELEGIAIYENSTKGLGLGKSLDVGLAATLIHPRVAITAAHCVGSQDEAKNLIGKTMTFYGQTVNIVSVNVRSESGIDNKDIALIEFSSPITSGPAVKLYKGERESLEDQWLLSLSYGPICSQNQMTPLASEGGILHLARTHYRKIYPNRTIVDTYGRSESFINTAQYPDNDLSNKFRGVGIGGDSGSPLFCKIGDEYQLVGICSSVSHGYLEVPANIDGVRAGYIYLNDEYEAFIRPNAGNI